MDQDEAGTGETTLERIMGRLAARLGGDATVRMVYGDPIQRGEVTVVPVARARYGFGAGRGPNGGDGEESGGGGGGAQVSPVGYIEIKNGEATFRNIWSLSSVLPLVIASGIAGGIVLRGITHLIGGKERS